MTAISRAGFTFLVYAPRSGSTYFARRLAEAYPSVLVMPEFRLPEFLMTAGDSRVRGMNRSDVARLLLADRQLKGSLGFTDELLRDLAEAVHGKGIAGILDGVVRAYSDRPRSHTVLKLGRAAAFDSTIREVLPGSKYIHILRDGRAVVNSLLATQKVYYPRENMGRDDVVWSSNIWNRHVDQVQHLQRNCPGRVITVRYEELVQDESGIMAELGPWFENGGMTPTREFMPGRTEGPLHRWIDADADLSRIDGWTKELGDRRAIVGEFLMRQRLQLLGYPLIFTRAVPRKDLVLLVAGARSRHQCVALVRAARRIASHWREPRLVLQHLNVAMMVRRARR